MRREDTHILCVYYCCLLGFFVQWFIYHWWMNYGTKRSWKNIERRGIGRKIERHCKWYNWTGTIKCTNTTKIGDMCATRFVCLDISILTCHKWNQNMRERERERERERLPWTVMVVSNDRWTLNAEMFSTQIALVCVRGERDKPTVHYKWYYGLPLLVVVVVIICLSPCFRFSTFKLLLN